MNNTEYFENWFAERKLLKLDYQITKLEDIDMILSINSKEIPILAACPSAGKTLTSICYIDYYLTHINPKGRVAILTHGTDVLRTQYHDDIEQCKPSFTYTNIKSGDDILTCNTQVVITLPQTLTRMQNLPNFDLVVVDEAHHYYLANNGMVSKIIKMVNAKKQLLLTGTPSSFIFENQYKKGKFVILPVTINDLLDYERIEDVIIEIASAPFGFKNKDYNSNYELKKDVKYTEKQVFETLDNVLKQILNRLRSILKNDPIKYAMVKRNGILKYAAEWKIVLQELEKTMLAAYDIKQAGYIKKYFDKIGVKSVISVSTGEYSDPHSVEMTKFKTDKDCPILIVVRRGTLGFNMPEMENVIDMSMSQNIDTIFQLLSRVIRPHPDGKKKLFFKVVPHNLSDYFEYVMTAVLCLTDINYYLKYNGKNFLDLEVPVVKISKDKKATSTPSSSNINNNVKKVKQNKFKAIEFIGLPSIRLFKDILHNNHEFVGHGYAYVKIREIRDLLLHDKTSWTLEDIMASARGNVVEDDDNELEFVDAVIMD